MSLAKRLDGSIVIGGVVALESTEILANTVDLNKGMKNCRNIVAIVAPNGWQAYKSFLFLAGGVNPVCADTKQRLIVASSPNVP